MKYSILLITLFSILAELSYCQNGDVLWTIPATDINPANYYGVTVANGMVGLVSSPEPMRVKDVVLNGVYDY